MLLYHSFAGAALTDARLRRAEGFRNGDGLLAAMASELSAARASGDVRSELDPVIEATTILSLVLGLSLASLLEQTTPEQALRVLDAHLKRL